MEIEVTEQSAGQRLDVFVTAQDATLTRAEAQRLIGLEEAAPEGVRVNGQRLKSNYRVRPGDRITLERPQPQPSRIEAESIPLAIVYEDADLLVIDKPRGMVVHPAPGSEHGTLVNAVLAYSDDLSGIGGEIRPGIVHRLDKDTGGLLMVAKNDAAHRALQSQIQEKSAERRYLALAWGVTAFRQATIEAPIGRHPTDRKKMAVLTDPRHHARPAVTELTVLETFAGVFSLLEARLQTGRTHQIRVHCAYLRHPLAGDALYGGQRKLPVQPFSSPSHAMIEHALEELGGQALHAASLAFTHPRTGRRLAFASPLPEPMQRLLELLRSVRDASEAPRSAP